MSEANDGSNSGLTQSGWTACHSWGGGGCDAGAKTETTRLNDGMQTKTELCIKTTRQTTKMWNIASQLFVLRPTETSSPSFHIIKLYVMLCMDGAKWGRMAPTMLPFSLLPAQPLPFCRCGRNEMTTNFRLCEIIMLRWGRAMNWACNSNIPSRVAVYLVGSGSQSAGRLKKIVSDLMKFVDINLVLASPWTLSSPSL